MISRVLPFSLCFIILFSCNTSKVFNSNNNIDSEYGISLEMNKFLLAFEKTVKKKSKTKLFRFIDVDYQKEQLGNLEGNRIQFINELFCGNKTQSTDFQCVNLNEIKSIRLVEMRKKSSTEYKASYIVSTDEFEVEVEWSIRFNSSNPNSGYGFIGAYG